MTYDPGQWGATVSQKMTNVEHTLSPRRTPPQEVRQLEARVLDILTEQPGLTRSEVALRLGVERTRLDRPITNLIHAAKILRDGQGRTQRRDDLQTTMVRFGTEHEPMNNVNCAYV